MWNDIQATVVLVKCVCALEWDNFIYIAKWKLDRKLSINCVYVLGSVCLDVHRRCLVVHHNHNFFALTLCCETVAGKLFHLNKSSVLYHRYYFLIANTFFIEWRFLVANAFLVKGRLFKADSFSIKRWFFKANSLGIKRWFFVSDSFLCKGRRLFVPNALFVEWWLFVANSLLSERRWFLISNAFIVKRRFFEANTCNK